MSKRHRVTATVDHHNLEAGFWALEDSQGNRWLPINMPEQLKMRGTKVRCVLEEQPDLVTTFNWGKPVRIISFETPGAS